MLRGIGAMAVLFLLLVSSGCGLARYNPLDFGWFKEKEEAKACSLAEQAEYQKALEAAHSGERKPVEVPTVEVVEPDQKIGKTTEDEIFVHKFVIRNTGKGVLKITKVISNCGSSVGAYDQTIPPGKEGVVTIRLNPGECDESKVKSAIVVTNDPEKPGVALKVKGGQ